MPKRAKFDYAPLTRLAFFNGLCLVAERRGVGLHEVMADEIEKHGLPAMLKEMAKFRNRTGEYRRKDDGE